MKYYLVFIFKIIFQLILFVTYVNAMLVTNEGTLNSDLHVMTSTGPILGKIVNDECTKPSRVWYGIPYAKPPIVSLRFKPTEPIEPWNTTLLAHIQPNSCYQRIFDHTGNDVLEITNDTMSEDCLYLNIVAPYMEYMSDELLPVFVWFPLGGFTKGSVSMPVYNFQKLTEIGHIIVVSINYRLSGLGFLRIDDDTAAGNMGLLDQQVALQWIHKNIINFGGDPDRITLFGSTHGAASSALHLVSPGSQGLFNKLILMNGAPNYAWGFENQTMQFEKAKALGESLGCPTDDNNTLFECVKTKPAFDLVSEHVGSVFVAHMPTVDGTFLNDTFENLIQNKNLSKISVIIGNIKNHGNAPAFVALETAFAIPMEQISNMVTKTIAVTLMNTLLKGIGEDPMKAEAVYDYYFNQSHSSFQSVADLTADYGYNCVVNDFARILRTRGAKVYKYVFNHTTSCTSSRRYIGIARNEDLLYLLGSPFECNFPIDFSCDEKNLSLGMIWLFTQFGRIGNPNDIWTPFSLEHEEYVSLDLLGPVMQTGFRKDQCLGLRQILSS